MLGFKLHRRYEAVSEEEFARSKRTMWLFAITWGLLLIVGLMIVNMQQWYYLLGMVLLFGLMSPAPVELFQSYANYKKKWLRHGGASRGERVARFG